MNDELKNVSLSFCCDKDWHSMRTVDEQKRFCESCKLNVIDFTKDGSQQFITSLQSSTRVCGRFKRSQMSESFLKFAASMAVASTVSMSCAPVEEPTASPDIPISIEQTIAEEVDFIGIVVSFPEDSIEWAPVPDNIPPDTMDFK